MTLSWPVSRSMLGSARTTREFDAHGLEGAMAPLVGSDALTYAAPAGRTD